MIGGTYRASGRDRSGPVAGSHRSPDYRQRHWAGFRAASLPSAPGRGDGLPSRQAAPRPRGIAPTLTVAAPRSGMPGTLASELRPIRARTRRPRAPGYPGPFRPVRDLGLVPGGCPWKSGELRVVRPCGSQRRSRLRARRAGLGADAGAAPAPNSASAVGSRDVKTQPDRGDRRKLVPADGFAAYWLGPQTKAPAPRFSGHRPGNLGVGRARLERDLGHASMQFKSAGAWPAARKPAMPATGRKPHG
jgi:hypothetical protein